MQPAVTILKATHIGPNEKQTQFVSAKVAVGDLCTTGPGSLFSEWITVKSDKPYVCKDEYGECWLDYADEYEGEEIPLAPYEVENFYANKRDEPLTTAALKAAIKALEEHFGIDLSHIKIINLADQ